MCPVEIFNLSLQTYISTSQDILTGFGGVELTLLVSVAQCEILGHVQKKEHT